MNRHEVAPDNSTLRAAIVPAEAAGLDADLLNVLRKRGGVWVPVTPTLAEIDAIVAAMAGAEPGRWYWLA